MRGWIFYKELYDGNKPEHYELHQLRDNAKDHNLDIEVLQPDQIDLIVTRDDEKSVRVDGKVTELPDFIMPRMGAGTTYFALAVIRHLERLGLKSFNSSVSIDTVKDKLFSQQILAENKLPVPKTMLVKFPINIELVEKQLKFPVVIKTLSGSQGSGVFLSEDAKHFVEFMDFVRATQPNANIILQEFIQTSYGQDLRVLVIGGRIVACVRRFSEDNSFKANFSRGGKMEEYKLTPEIEWLALESAKLLGLDIAGIDLLFDGDGYKICEANSSPGFEGLEKFCKINVASEIYRFINLRLGK
ncbi:MAG: RimK family alpha-L-glutamate ligase [Richelia sp. RM2_1_2]|nr:RimK family alpha-L-glutamate ligase [Richelia sp. RM2_1_2]